MSDDDDDRDARALRRLAEAYGFAVDRRDAAGFLGLFTPDGELGVHAGDSPNATRHYLGHEQLAQVIVNIGRFASTMHGVTSHRAWPEGRTARAECYCTAHHLTPTGEGRADDLVLHIRYDDRCVRGADGVWRFTRREVHRLWSRTQAVDVP